MGGPLKGNDSPVGPEFKGRGARQRASCRMDTCRMLIGVVEKDVYASQILFNSF